MKEIKIAIGADVVPTMGNLDFFINPNVGRIASSELISLLESCDYRIFNCESPLTDSNDPIKKCGPNLKSPTRSIMGFKTLKTDLLTLANNHIMDYGDDGLSDTIQTLKKEHLAFCGVGKDRKNASCPYVFELAGYKVGVYCCTEHEFSFATEDSPGANAFNPLYSLDEIVDLRKKSDLLIVLYHGGKELYQYPTPGLQEICHRIIDCGADIVLCQHSHCIGARETYKKKEILYGQGNFLFERSNNKLTKEGLLAIIRFNEEGFEVEYIPTTVFNGCVSLADEKEKDRILSEFNARSRYIESSRNVQIEFEKLCNCLAKNYLFAIGSRSIIGKFLNKLSNGLLVQHKYKKEKALCPLNFIECETHREILIKCLKNVAEVAREK